MSPQNTPSALAALNGARATLAHFETPRNAEDLAADIIDLWTGAETALQSLVGNASLTGQQLIRAARQAELITLDQAHTLLEFLAARDRANRTSYKPTQADGDAAVDGFRALESALTGAAPAARGATAGSAAGQSHAASSAATSIALRPSLGGRWLSAAAGVCRPEGGRPTDHRAPPVFHERGRVGRRRQFRRR